MRQECELRQRELLRLRDARAAELGRLAMMRSEVERAVAKGFVGDAAVRLQEVVGADPAVGDVSSYINSPNAVAQRLNRLLFVQLPGHASDHAKRIATLGRPSRLTLIWPQLAMIPPVTIIAFRLIYGSREAIMETLLQAHDTVKGFWFGYVLQPIREILDTVRMGGDEGARLVSQEGVKADIEVCSSDIRHICYALNWY